MLRGTARRRASTNLPKAPVNIYWRCVPTIYSHKQGSCLATSGSPSNRLYENNLWPPTYFGISALTGMGNGQLYYNGGSNPGITVQQPYSIDQKMDDGY